MAAKKDWEPRLHGSGQYFLDVLLSVVVVIANQTLLIDKNRYRKSIDIIDINPPINIDW